MRLTTVHEGTYIYARLDVPLFAQQATVDVHYKTTRLDCFASQVLMFDSMYYSFSKTHGLYHSMLEGCATGSMAAMRTMSPIRDS
jgi:hypothetical protein